MVHVSDDRHVPDVGLVVHDLTDLVYRKVHLEKEKGEFRIKVPEANQHSLFRVSIELAKDCS